MFFQIFSIYMDNKDITNISKILFEAGSIALEYFQGSYTCSTKRNASDFVTEADIVLDKFLTKEISQLFPEDTIVSEEWIQEDIDWSGRVWSIDPIDGTYDFVHGQSGWSIMIWLSIDWIPKFWYVYCPMYDMLYIGWATYGAWKISRWTNQKETIIFKEGRRSEAKITYSSNFNTYMEPAERDYLHTVFPASFLDTDMCFDRMFVEEAQWHVWWINDCWPWDICAPAAILYGTGWSMYDEYGEEIDFKQRCREMWCIASDGFIDNVLLETVENIRKKCI